MSGFIAIAAGNGRSIERNLLQLMTNSLAFRGPDRQDLWSGLGAGLGHALFATTHEAVKEKLPCSLDGEVWITADCRVDARDELHSKLEGRGCVGVRTATDPELILHAYHAWGDDCVDHLLGDFAFALWDARRRRLFCARDHFGVKLCYYAMPGPGLVVSNTLNCIRLHPSVSDRWNDVAICDFLMMGMLLDNAITTFADIHSLPPAHVLVWEKGRLSLRRYWRLPVEEPVRFRRSRDYVDRFHELLGQAVKDRLRTDRLTVQMSGGLDSTLLAATARQVSECEIRAMTVASESLIPDDERHFAEMAARHLGIPIEIQLADAYRPFDGAAPLAARRPEPANAQAMARRDDFRAGLERFARVSFYGEGPDNLLLYEWKAYFKHLREQGCHWQAAADLGRSFWLQKRIPFTYWIHRRLAGQPSHHPPELPQFPDWLQPELVQRLDLRRRWQDSWRRGPFPHPCHPAGYPSMLSPLWLRMFTDADPGVNGRLVETRHPYLDLRVARYLLSLPVVPWCRRKLIMRLAAASLLPNEIVRRLKTPVFDDPMLAHHRQGRFEGLEHPPLSEFSHYVTRWPDLDARSSQALTGTLTPVSLGLWWRGQLLGKNVLEATVR